MHSDITADPQIRLAVAQTTPRHDPFDIEVFEAAAREIRELMRRARSGGADIIQFPEAALCFPDKHSLSSRAPDLGEADWSAYPWDPLNTALPGRGGRSETPSVGSRSPTERYLASDDD